MSKGNNALTEPTPTTQDMRRGIINMKQSIELAIARIYDARMEELAIIIRKYTDELQKKRNDGHNHTDIIARLYNTRQGLIVAFNTIFDIPYYEYDRDYLE